MCSVFWIFPKKSKLICSRSRIKLFLIDKMTRKSEKKSMKIVSLKQWICIFICTKMKHLFSFRFSDRLLSPMTLCPLFGTICYRFQQKKKPKIENENRKEHEDIGASYVFLIVRVFYSVFIVLVIDVDHFKGNYMEKRKNMRNLA